MIIILSFCCNVKTEAGQGLVESFPARLFSAAQAVLGHVRGAFRGGSWKCCKLHACFNEFHLNEGSVSVPERLASRAASVISHRVSQIRCVGRFLPPEYLDCPCRPTQQTRGSTLMGNPPPHVLAQPGDLKQTPPPGRGPALLLKAPALHPALTLGPMSLFSVTTW